MMSYFFGGITADNKIMLMLTQPMLEKTLKYLWQIHNIFVITNKLLLQQQALSNCDNFTVITILQ